MGAFDRSLHQDRRRTQSLCHHPCLGKAAGLGRGFCCNERERLEWQRGYGPGEARQRCRDWERRSDGQDLVAVIC